MHNDLYKLSTSTEITMVAHNVIKILVLAQATLESAVQKILKLLSLHIHRINNTNRFVISRHNYDIKIISVMI